MRVVITGLDESGRSAAIAVRESNEVEVWKSEIAEVPEWIVGSEKLMSFEPDPGWIKCWAMSTPPETEEYIPPVGYDAESGSARELHDALTSGMHKTLTSEVVFIFDPITLILETGTVDLQSGDIVVLRGVMHDWRNGGDGPARTAGVVWAVRR